ncbi:MAG: RNA polymerase sigma factor, partial [Planctomycetia bacterium]
YFAHAPRLMRLFQDGGLCAADAQSAMQTVFCKVMNTRTERDGVRSMRYDPARGAAFRTWITRIAVNVLIDLRRRGRRSVDFTSVEADRGGRDDEREGFAVRVDPRQARPEEDVIRRESCERVRECVDRLPPRERKVVEAWLASDGRARLRDLADELDTTISTARRLMLKAMQRLRRELAVEGAAA